MARHIGILIWQRLVPVLVALMIGALSVPAQKVPVPVPGLPTNEVFDLLVDRKGFLWVGHDMGISRYNGVGFTHFQHPQRSSFSVTDLVEDPQGRIWCHNFTGQIFYIENERMHWLSAYKNESENFFPRMALCGPELVVTSNRGLFVIDTRNLKTRYVTLGNRKAVSTKSLAAFDGQVLALNINQFYLYDKKKGLRAIRLLGDPLTVKNRNLSLQPGTFRDTAFTLVNPSGTVYKLVRHRNEIKLVDTISTNQFINSVQTDATGYWVHGRAYSFGAAPSESAVPEHYNISDRAVDQQGNEWYSSLTRGLLVVENQRQIRKLAPKIPGSDDLVTAMETIGNKVLIGTKNGYLYECPVSLSEKTWQYRFPADFGTVNYISPEVDGKMFISTSGGTFLFYPRKKELSMHFSFITKELVVSGKRILVASALGLYAFSSQSNNGRELNKRILSLGNWNRWWQHYLRFPEKDDPMRFYWYLQRSRSVTQTSDGDLYVSFMNGVYGFYPQGVRPVLYQQKKIYANSMVADGDRLFLGTFNNGILIKEGNRFNKIGLTEGLLSNSVVRLKKDGRKLWVMLDRGTQLLDLKTNELLNNIELPQETGANTYAVATVHDTALLATNTGIYRVVLRPSEKYKSLRTRITLVRVSQTDSLTGNEAELAHRQNDLEFHLAVPWYNGANNLYFKYRLAGAANGAQWYTTAPGERTIRFASLAPGSYQFEAHAVVAGFQEPQPVVFTFTVRNPWWRTNTFYLLLMGTMVALFWAVNRVRVRQILQLEQVRRSISSDLHDEIGSTISSINIYSELAKTEKENTTYLSLIQENAREVISKLDDLVWSINPKNDTLSQLVARMQLFAEPLLLGAGIQPQFDIGAGLDNLELPLAAKRNLYLLFKELVHNVVKHAKASNCIIEIKLEHKKQLCLSVTDDGVGIPDSPLKPERSGMENLTDRARQLKAVFELKSTGQGTRAQVRVPLR